MQTLPRSVSFPHDREASSIAHDVAASWMGPASETTPTEQRGDKETDSG
jgi:hypothetical protein